MLHFGSEEWNSSMFLVSCSCWHAIFDEIPRMGIEALVHALNYKPGQRGLSKKRRRRSTRS